MEFWIRILVYRLLIAHILLVGTTPLTCHWLLGFYNWTRYASCLIRDCALQLSSASGSFGVGLFLRAATLKALRSALACWRAKGVIALAVIVYYLGRLSSSSLPRGLQCRVYRPAVSTRVRQYATRVEGVGAAERRDGVIGCNYNLNQQYSADACRGLMGPLL